MLEGYDKFLKLRRYVLDALDKVDMSNGCKPYEGEFEIAFSYLNYFEEADCGRSDEPDFYDITLHCYVLGPKRHYHWYGSTIEQAVRNCYRDVSKWIKEEQEADYGA